MQGDEKYIYSPIGEAINIEEDTYTVHMQMQCMPARRGNEAAAAFGCGVPESSPLARQVG